MSLLLELKSAQSESESNAKALEQSLKTCLTELVPFGGAKTKTDSGCVNTISLSQFSFVNSIKLVKVEEQSCSPQQGSKPK